MSVDPAVVWLIFLLLHSAGVVTDAQLGALAASLERLNRDFGGWAVADILAVLEEEMGVTRT